jgi:site-specific DNA recombinase
MRVIGYARVSTREQSENSHALEQQIARLKAAGATEILQDIDTGSNDKRPNFIILMQLIKENAIQELIVTRIDRLTRKLRTILEIRDIFEKSSCNFRALDDSIDLSSPGGKFHLNLLGSLAEMETDRLGERVRHGWNAMRKDKRVAVAPFGYLVTPESKLGLDHRELLCLLETKETLAPVDLARDLIEFFLEAKTLRGCLRLFNEKYGIRRYNNGSGRKTWNTLSFSHSGLSTWLKNPTLLGHTYYPLKRGRATKEQDWEIYTNTHEPIMSIDERYQIEQIIQANRLVKGYGTSKRRHAVAGLAICSECRSTMYSVAGTRGKTPGYNYYFQCKRWRSRECSQKITIRVEIVENAVIEALAAKAEELANRVESETPNIGNIAEIEKLQAQLAGLEKLGDNPALTQAKREIERQIYSLQMKSNQTIATDKQKRKLLLQAFQDKTFWSNLELEDKKRLFHEFIDRVLVLNGQIVEIVLKPF